MYNVLYSRYVRDRMSVNIDTGGVYLYNAPIEDPNKEDIVVMSTDNHSTDTITVTDGTIFLNANTTAESTIFMRASNGHDSDTGRMPIVTLTESNVTDFANGEITVDHTNSLINIGTNLNGTTNVTGDLNIEGNVTSFNLQGVPVTHFHIHTNQFKSSDPRPSDPLTPYNGTLQTISESDAGNLTLWQNAGEYFGDSEDPNFKYIIDQSYSQLIEFSISLSDNESGSSGISSGGLGLRFYDETDTPVITYDVFIWNIIPSRSTVILTALQNLPTDHGCAYFRVFLGAEESTNVYFGSDSTDIRRQCYANCKITEWESF